MTQEERQLLFKDLCARLPYGVKVDVNFYYATKELSCDLLQDIISDEKSVRPYLRPMSSMSEKERDELALIGDNDFQVVRKWYNAEYMNETGTPCPVTSGQVDYCNKNHFDFRGLIPMGIALEAPEGMYKNE